MIKIIPLLVFITASVCLFGQKDCRYADYKQEVWVNHPESSQNNQVIDFLSRSTSFDMLQGIESAGVQAPQIITIPVVVHVLYNNAQQNISDAQIQSQIDALNKDYRGTNADRKNVPSYFASFAADCGFEFRLARVDPKGFATTGIVRRQTSIQMFGTNDRIKSAKIGGDDAWDSNKYLNIWIGNLAGGILGYASSPGASAEKDGVVIHFNVFGAGAAMPTPFDLGRTATHEIGHWLNLRHIWGDAYCGDDGVDDTPKQRSSNRGCPEGRKFSCEMNKDGDMYMNFMDLTNDACMFMFTHGQRQKMRALFESGGSRHVMLSSNALSGVPLTAAIELPVQQLPQNRVAVYPNPASSVIIIEVENKENVVNNSITIYNSIGQPVINQVVNGNRISLNISHLKRGAYFIKSGNHSFGGLIKFLKN